MEIEEINLRMSHDAREFFEYQDYLRRRICDIYGIPPSLLSTLPSKWWHKFVIFRPELTIDQIVYL